MRFVRLIPLVAAALLVGASAAQAQVEVEVQEEPVGPVIEVGLEAGQYNGLSGKLWTSSNTAIQAGLAWRAGDHQGTAVHGSYLFHSRPVVTGDVKVPLYAGPGAMFVNLDDDPIFGVRAPLGAEAILTEIPVAAFAEIAPGILFEPDEEQFVAEATLGARLYF